MRKQIEQVKLPCDECSLKDICGMVGSRKRAANRIDRIMEDVEDEFLEIPIICKRQQKDTAVTVGKDTSGDMQEVLPFPVNGDGHVQDDDGDLPGVSVGAAGAE